MCLNNKTTALILFYICLYTAVIIGAGISTGVILGLVILIVICVISWIKKKGELLVTCKVCQKIYNIIICIYYIYTVHVYITGTILKKYNIVVYFKGYITWKKIFLKKA